VWKAFLFGVIVSATVGPIALIIFGTGARQGFASGAVAALGRAMPGERSRRAISRAAAAGIIAFGIHGMTAG